MAEDTSAPLLSGIRLEDAGERIDVFREQFGFAYLYFAQHAAFPMSLTPDLLYRLWANFQRDIDGEKLHIPWIAVADLLLSPLCEEVSYELYEMDVAVRAELLSGLKANYRFGQRRINELSHFLLDYVRQQIYSSKSSMRDFAQTQQWTALAYIQPERATKELAEALKTLDQNNKIEQVRLVSLMETLNKLAEPLSALEGFAPLLTYARGVERLARGDRESAKAQFNAVKESEQALGVRLPIYEQVEGESGDTTQQIQDTRKVFFVIYHASDTDWAIWVARQLEGEGYSSMLQAWNFQPGADFAEEMDAIAKLAKHLIVILSPAYLNALIAMPEWIDAFQQYSRNGPDFMVGLHVRECRDALNEILGLVDYTDFVELDEEGARQALLNRISNVRASTPQSAIETQKIVVLCCSASEDKKLVERFQTHLRVLESQDTSIWYTHDIPAGLEWERERENQLQSAHLILLLVSSDFLSSHEQYEKTVVPAMERYKKGEALVVPIILRPVDWQGTVLGQLQPLPDGGKPVTDRGWHTEDHAFLNIVKGIKRVLSNEKLLPPELSKNGIPKESTPADFDVTAQLEHIIQDFRSLRGQIADAVRLKVPQGFSVESCENQYNRLYRDTLVFLTTNLPQSVSNEEGFVEVVYNKAAAELRQRSNFSVWLARQVITPLAKLEKLAAQIDACVATLELYTQKYFKSSLDLTALSGDKVYRKEGEPMKEPPQFFDICIICALSEEARAVIDEFSRRCHISFAKAYHGLDHYEYQYSAIQNRDKESLTMLVTWLPEMGPLAMAQEVKSLVQQFHPRFMAMTGICAGDQRKVQLGDIIVASAAYHYEEGKMTNGPKGHQPAVRTFSPPDQVLQYARGFTGWERPIIRMKEQFIKKQDTHAMNSPNCFVAVMASAMAVREDDPFPWLQQQYHRQTLALDMEAASFYAALRSFTNALVIKGVSDYADVQKRDDYHDYAARVSAVYLLHFIQEYVTEQTMPRQYSSNNAKVKQGGNPPTPTNIRVTSSPSREGNKAIILFDLNGTEHSLEYIRYDEITRQTLFLKEKQQELVRMDVPFATLNTVEKQAPFHIDGVDGLLTFKMSAATGIMNISVKVGGVEVFHN